MENKKNKLAALLYSHSMARKLEKRVAEEKR